MNGKNLPEIETPSEALIEDMLTVMADVAVDLKPIRRWRHLLRFGGFHAHRATLQLSRTTQRGIVLQLQREEGPRQETAETSTEILEPPIENIALPFGEYRFVIEPKNEEQPPNLMPDTLEMILRLSEYFRHPFFQTRSATLQLSQETQQEIVLLLHQKRTHQEASLETLPTILALLVETVELAFGKYCIVIEPK